MIRKILWYIKYGPKLIAHKYTINKQSLQKEYILFKNRKILNVLINETPVEKYRELVKIHHRIKKSDINY